MTFRDCWLVAQLNQHLCGPGGGGGASGGCMYFLNVSLYGTLAYTTVQYTDSCRGKSCA